MSVVEKKALKNWKESHYKIDKAAYNHRKPPDKKIKPGW